MCETDFLLENFIFLVSSFINSTVVTLPANMQSLNVTASFSATDIPLNSVCTQLAHTATAINLLVTGPRAKSCISSELKALLAESYLNTLL